jgi:site-specific recombinase XerD
VISDSEFQEMLDKANQIKDTFMRLRSTALLCLFRLTGKRREEIAPLELDSFKTEEHAERHIYTTQEKERNSVDKAGEKSIA